MSTRVRSISSALIVFLFGIWLGRITAFVPPVSPAPNVPQAESSERRAASVEQSASSSPSGQTVDRAVVHLPDGWESDPRVGLARSLAEWGGDPGQILEVIIDSMSDRELRVALTSLTNFKEDQLDGVRDMRRFTRRVAEVAVDSIYGQASADPPSVVEVQFSRAVDVQNGAESPQELFSDEGRIYAVFPMDEYREDEVFVKWFRTDDPEILLFDQYPIQSGAEFSYVWLEQDQGWTEGEYAVEFYSADESLQKIARGLYVVGPTTASLGFD